MRVYTGCKMVIGNLHKRQCMSCKYSMERGEVLLPNIPLFTVYTRWMLQYMTLAGSLISLRLTSKITLCF